MRTKKRKNSKQFNSKFKKRFLTKKSGVIWILTLFIVLVIGCGFFSLEKKAVQYRKTVKELSTEISKLEKDNKKLTDEMEHMNSKEFIEKMARERLKMIGKDEISLQKSDSVDETEESTTEEPDTGDTTSEQKDASQE